MSWEPTARRSSSSAWTAARPHCDPAPTPPGWPRPGRSPCRHHRRVHRRRRQPVHRTDPNRRTGPPSWSSSAHPSRRAPGLSGRWRPAWCATARWPVTVVPWQHCRTRTTAGSVSTCGSGGLRLGRAGRRRLLIAPRAGRRCRCRRPRTRRRCGGCGRAVSRTGLPLPGSPASPSSCEGGLATDPTPPGALDPPGPGCVTTLVAAGSARTGCSSGRSMARRCRPFPARRNLLPSPWCAQNSLASSTSLTAGPAPQRRLGRALRCRACPTGPGRRPHGLPSR